MGKRDQFDQQVRDDNEAQRERMERVAGFRALGFDELDALSLADSTASISYVRDSLLKRGATHEQAVRVAL